VRPGSLAWDGNESLALRGAPFPRDLVFASGPDSFAFVAAAPPGVYSIALSRLGTSGAEVTQTREIRITRMSYETHAPASPRSFPAGLPARVFLALGLAVARDSIENFRFSFPSSTPVTARAEWDGPANIDLRWRSCADPNQTVGNMMGATATRPEITSVTVPGGECWLLQVVLQPPLTENPVIKLDVTSP